MDVRKHHESLGVLVGHLSGSVPLSPDPLLLDPIPLLDVMVNIPGDDLQKPEVLVTEGSWGELPRSVETGSISVAPTDQPSSHITSTT